MRYRFFLCDVFTNRRFGGNPLAVLPEASGLSARDMQQIAREFNFSESAFVFPAAHGHTRHVRIFTPTMEVPFAGHPNVGTAFVLATTGAFGPIGKGIDVTFEEKAGLVPITVRTRHETELWCELAAPQPLSLGKMVSVDTLARAVSLAPDEIVTTIESPRIASVGLPFVIAEVCSRAALERARANMSGLEMLVAEGVIPDVFLYTRSQDEVDIRARMFAPLDGVPEDPATGSASCALAGLLAARAGAANGQVSWRIAQGVEMGRPSLLEVRADKRDGVVRASYVAGTCVLVGEGYLDCGEASTS